MSESQKANYIKAILLADHVRLLDEACVSLSENELRCLVVEIGEEVQSFYQAKPGSTDKEDAFNLSQFVALSLAQAQAQRGG
jgi:hypothetical protein